MPLVESYSACLPYGGKPEITDLHYDLWTLRITVRFKEIPFYVVFKNVSGLRVLDEGDLLEFWGKEVRVDGWLWRIRRGGWHDLESRRQGFMSDFVGEFLVVGKYECVSVFTPTDPDIRSS